MNRPRKRKRKRRRRKRNDSSNDRTRNEQQRGVATLIEGNKKQMTKNIKNDKKETFSEDEIRGMIKEEMAKLNEGNIKDMIEAARTEVERHEELGKEIAFKLSQEGDTEMLEKFTQARTQYLQALEELANET